MDNTLKILQVNADKSPGVQLSVMNDERIMDFGVIALLEPNLRRTEEVLRAVSMGHSICYKEDSYRDALLLY